MKVNLDKDTWSFSSVNSKRLYINGLVIDKQIPNDFEISLYAPEKIKVNKLVILDSPKISLYCPKRLDVSSSIINSENVSFKSNIMNIENTYINGEEYLGKDENNIPIGMNKKLEKVKSK